MLALSALLLFADGTLKVISEHPWKPCGWSPGPDADLAGLCPPLCKAPASYLGSWKTQCRRWSLLQADPAVRREHLDLPPDLPSVSSGLQCLQAAAGQAACAAFPAWVDVIPGFRNPAWRKHPFPIPAIAQRSTPGVFHRIKMFLYIPPLLSAVHT